MIRAPTDSSRLNAPRYEAEAPFDVDLELRPAAFRFDRAFREAIAALPVRQTRGAARVLATAPGLPCGASGRSTRTRTSMEVRLPPFFLAYVSCGNLQFVRNRCFSLAVLSPLFET